jgi:hypothetical protein
MFEVAVGPIAVKEVAVWYCIAMRRGLTVRHLAWFDDAGVNWTSGQVAGWDAALADAAGQ